MIDLTKGREFQQEAFKDRDMSVIANHNADIVWKSRWKAWLITNGKSLLDEIQVLRAKVMRLEQRPVPEKPKHFNFQTRLQILAILMKDVVEKGTPEAEERFKKALHEHQQIFTDRE